MKKMPSIHPLIELNGTPRACGQQYGEQYAEMIVEFLYLELKPDARRLRYARACWQELSRWDPYVAAFVRGMAEGSGLSLAQIALLILHEENCHTEHCTAIGATGAGTRDGQPIIGQTWDWPAALYPWPHLTRLKARGVPRSFLYSLPGLWSSVGINEHGLSLIWTTTGVLPKIPPRIGIPSYALVAGILARRDCSEALDLVRRTRNAGCFNFLIADAKGEVWVIEGFPHTAEAVPCRDIIVRANHYESERMCGLSKQNMLLDKFFSRKRSARMAELAAKCHGRIDGKAVEKFLSDEDNGRGSISCRPRKTGGRWLTLDAFYCRPAEREFSVARGLPSRHEFRHYSV